MCVFLALVALSGGLGACTGPLLAPPPVDVSRGEWRFGPVEGIELVTPHYRIRTTCTQPQLVDRLPQFVEGCWDAYARLIPPKKTNVQPALTHLFQRRREWEEFTRQFSPGRASTYLLIRSGGYEERGITVSHYDRMSTTFPVLAHEGLHQYLTLTRGGTLPPWLNEGLACHFESFDLDDHGRPTFLPRRNAIRRNNLRDSMLSKGMFPLEELLGTNAGRVVGLPSARVRAYYSQLWALVVMLAELDPAKDTAGAGFRELLGDLGSATLVARARKVMTASRGETEFGLAVFKAYVTEDVGTFEQRYVRYARNLLQLN